MQAYYDFPNNHINHKERYNKLMHGYIDPEVQFNGPIKIGLGVIIEGNVIFAGENFVGHRAIIRPNCYIGFGSEIRINAWLAPDCTIGNYSVIYNYANLAMGTKVGSYVYFGVHSITTNAHDIVLHRNRVFVPDHVVIKDGARIATNVTIAPGLCIGRNSLIGMGSNITKDVGDGEIWFGNPAQKKGLVDINDIPEAWRK
jgi:acetyltransferase-like isoleucine patch superfamily enzyme